MNTQTENPPATSEACSIIEAPTPRRPRPHPTCKIGRLPADIREMINESLANNLSYPEIIARLDASGHPDFTANNLSRWAYSGYVIWLQNRENKHFLRLHTDASSDLMRELDASDSNACSRVNHVYMSTQLGQLMRGLDLKPLRRKLESDPATFFRLVRSVNAQTRNTIREQKIQRDAAKKTRPVAPNNNAISVNILQQRVPRVTPPPPPITDCHRVSIHRNPLPSRPLKTNKPTRAHVTLYHLLSANTAFYHQKKDSFLL